MKITIKTNTVSTRGKKAEWLDKSTKIFYKMDCITIRTLIEVAREVNIPLPSMPPHPPKPTLPPMPPMPPQPPMPTITTMSLVQQGELQPNPSLEARVLPQLKEGMGAAAGDLNRGFLDKNTLIKIGRAHV